MLCIDNQMHIWKVLRVNIPERKHARPATRNILEVNDLCDGWDEYLLTVAGFSWQMGGSSILFARARLIFFMTSMFTAIAKADNCRIAVWIRLRLHITLIAMAQSNMPWHTCQKHGMQSPAH